MQTCRKELYARLLSRSPGKTAMERLKAQRTPRHRTGLTRTPSPALNRAAQAHALREAGRGIGATDGGALHRSTYIRRQDKTLPMLNEFVAIAGRCPPPERGMSARVRHEGAQRLQGKGAHVCV